MPISGQKGTMSDAEGVQHMQTSAEDKKKLALLIGEMRARGLPIPDAMKLKKIWGSWSIGPNGYFIKSNGTEYFPNEPQGAFITSRAARVAIFGGRGSGKTVAGAQKSLIKLKAGESGMVMNPDFENLRTSTWPELRQWIPWDMVVPAHRYRKDESWEAVKPFALAFMNGSKMYVKGLHDPESARGPNVNWLWYDEGGRDKTGLGWKIATGGVRIGKEPQAYVTTTPKGTLHWTYEFFIKQIFPEEVQKLMTEFAVDRPFIEYWFATIDENKDHLSPDFYATMLATYPSGWLRKQELEGQFANEEGTLGSRRWFDGKLLPMCDPDAKTRVRYWDLAGTEKKITGRKANDPDWTIGTRMSKGGAHPFVIEDQTGGQWAWHDIKANIIKTAYLDGPLIPIVIEQEPASGGINQIAEIKELSELAGFTVRGDKPIGDKVQRANPWFSRASTGLMWMVRGEWNEDFLAQVDNFPTDGTHDDRVDSVSGCFKNLNPFRAWNRMQFLHLGGSIEESNKQGFE
jgi:predicted phage terminase large subunit-like protein